MIVAAAALDLTSGSSLPTKRKIRLPMGGNKAQARIVYRFLLLPTALGPPVGAGCPGGGGGICDMETLLQKLIGARPIMGRWPSKRHSPDRSSPPRLPPNLSLLASRRDDRVPSTPE